MGSFDAIPRRRPNPVDNNASERALRVAALGRRNDLLVGHDDAGQNAAVLYSFVSTCEALGVNPLDDLIRVQTRPNSAIDELLPHQWHPPDDQADSKRAPSHLSPRSANTGLPGRLLACYEPARLLLLQTAGHHE